MKRLGITLLVSGTVIHGLLAAGERPPAQQEFVGLLSKVILDVSRMESGKKWEKAVRGQPLGPGDMIRTGIRSLAVIKFKDNSLVRVRELTELAITGTLDDKRFSKSVDLTRGGVGFVISKQLPQEEFRFRSPTSVASIRGTRGAFSIGQEDTLTVLDGLVQIQNSISSETVDVIRGYTAISRSDGSVESRPSTSEERESAQGAIRSSDIPRQLRLQLRNSRGEVEELIIDFKEE